MEIYNELLKKQLLEFEEILKQMGYESTQLDV